MLAFFSYSHIDAESEGPLIAEIQTELERKTRAAWGKRSFEIWRDARNLRWGVNWPQAIEAAIGDCDLFVLLLSPGWLQSPDCRQEFETFKKREAVLGTGERVLIAQILEIPEPLLSSDAQLHALFDEIGTRQRKMWMKLADSVEFDRMKIYREAASEIAALLFAIKSPEESRELVAEEGLATTAAIESDAGAGPSPTSPLSPAPPPAAAAGTAPPGGESGSVAVEQQRGSEKSSCVAVGSQLVSFAPAISGELREGIAQSLLFAQLAANNADPEREGDARDWVTKLVSVLSNIGWRVSSKSEATLSVDQGDTDVRGLLEQTLLSMSPKETQEEVQALFHRALEAPSCAKTDLPPPWSQLFERQARVIDGARFQITHVSQRESGEVVLHLLAVKISGQMESTAALFFRWQDLSQGKIDVQRFQLTLEERVFNSVKDVVARRIAAYTRDYIAALDI